MFVHYTGRFLRLHRVKLTVDRVQVENRLTFATVVAVDRRLDTKLKPKRKVPFKNIFSARAISSGHCV